MRRWNPSAVLLVLGALAVGAGPLHASPADTVGLRAELERLATAHQGVVGISLRDLASGTHLSLRGDEPFPSASLIKVSILVALLGESAEGRVRLDERLPLRDEERVGGSGVLRHMAAGLEPTVEDAAWLMTILSDNTATNLVLDRIGVETVWRWMDRLELPRTRVFRKVFHPNSSSPMPDSAAVYGLGVTTPDETTRLLELLHRGRAVSQRHDSLALAMLRANQDAGKLVRGLPAGVAVAHKSGDIDRARNDCGILYTPSAPLALCVMTRENADTRYGVDNAAHLLMGRVARAVFARFDPAAPLPPEIGVTDAL